MRLCRRLLICIGVVAMGSYVVASDVGLTPGDLTPKDHALLNQSVVKLTTDHASVREGLDRSIDLWVELTPPVAEEVQVRLAIDGTATVGRDFGIDDLTIHFKPNQNKARTRIQIFDDWMPEGDERITVRVAEVSLASASNSDASLEITLQDDNDRLHNKELATAHVDLYIRDYEISYDRILLTIVLYNQGLRASSATEMSISVDEWLAPGQFNRNVDVLPEISVPSIRSLRWFSTEASIDLMYPPNSIYWIRVSAGASSDWVAFEMDEVGRIKTRCEPPLQRPSREGEDPLFNHQWPLHNVGQAAFAEKGGSAAEDLGMTFVLSSESPTGRGVNVAVVDTGLVICHPDLAANIANNGSFNFKYMDSERPSWFGARWSDPYLPDVAGDHGTSVAGTIGAIGNNGIGVRGVAPDVRLFGFNYLAEQCCEEDALGGSNSYPDSSQIDVFNLSYGGRYGSQYNEPDNSIVRYGTAQLRDGLGAIYVKSGGNSFFTCINSNHDLHDVVGCRNSHGDGLNDQPYVIAVGTLNANGEKSSYASTGSNLWISAPAGDRGEPKTLTTDQIGLSRGYSSYGSDRITKDPSAVNGDYRSGFQGSSAAAAHVSGVVALLLEEEPLLTWRDVKHILASTARRPAADKTRHTYVQIAIDDYLTTFSRDWVTNAAGFSFHNYFGFGAVDVDAALSFLRNEYKPDGLGKQTRSDWFTATRNVVYIPDYDGEGLVLRHFVDLPSRVSIEAVQLWVDIQHDYLADLSIELTSPEGTPSIVSPAFNDMLVGASELNWVLLSNAFYGESPRGMWTLHVVDAAMEDIGYVESWGVRVWYGE